MLPIHLAAQYGNEATLAKVIEYSLKWIDRPMNNGYRPLHIAAGSGNIAAVKQLIQAGANLAALDNEKNTPLQIACKFKYFEVAYFLIQQSELVKSKGETPLIAAALMNQPDLVEYISKHHLTPQEKAAATAAANVKATATEPSHKPRSALAAEASIDVPAIVIHSAEDQGEKAATEAGNTSVFSKISHADTSGAENSPSSLKPKKPQRL